MCDGLLFLLIPFSHLTPRTNCFSSCVFQLYQLRASSHLCISWYVMSSYLMVPATAATPPLSPDGVPNLNLGVVTCSRYPATGHEEAFPKIIKKVCSSQLSQKKIPAGVFKFVCSFVLPPRRPVMMDTDPLVYRQVPLSH
jgi:hypothetical protein